MAQVQVTINGRVYRMGCEEGQEHVLLDLAGDIDSRIDAFRAEFGEVGDMRLLIMAALAIGDDLNDARRRLDAAQKDIEELRAAGTAAQARAASTERALAETLDVAVGRVEQLTASLNGDSRV